MGNVQFYMAARERIVDGTNHKLGGAILALPDNDEQVKIIEEAYKQWLGGTTKEPLDAIELLLAKLVDDGAELPVSNKEAYAGARWISKNGLATMPNPMPRQFALYLASGLAAEGKYATVTLALKDILATKSFI